MPSHFRLVVILMISFAPGTILAEEVSDFYNVLLSSGADPWVVRHDGQYYLIQSGWGGVTLRRSPSLSGLGAGEAKLIWRPPAGQPYSHGIWAPELHRLNGKWYVYFAADNGLNDTHRMYVLENDSENPFEGEYVFRGKITDSSDRWAIDGTVLQDKDQLYFIWSGWEGEQNVRQNLYIAPMSDPLTISGRRVLISTPEFDWERRGNPHVNEGPQVLVHNGRVFVIYSASGSWTDHYCLGVLESRLGADLLNPARWRKRDRPVFVSANDIIAPGHCCFVKSPDGTQDWIVYHATRFSGGGWSRSIRAQPFKWSRNDFPLFGQPASPNEPIPLPSGDPSRQRYQAEAAELGSNVQIRHDPKASKGRKVRNSGRSESFVVFHVNLPADGEYGLALRYANSSTNRRDRSGCKVFVNNQPAGAAYCPGTGGGWSNSYLRVTLTEGDNAIRIDFGSETLDFDCLDVFSL